MKILLASKDDLLLENIGTESTDWGYVPLFCDDVDVLLESLQDQTLNVQIILLDLKLLPTSNFEDSLRWILDIRSSQLERYPYLIVLHRDLSPKEESQLRVQGVDSVLPRNVSIEVLFSHIQVASRIMKHHGKLEALQESLWNQANFDPLTEIPNRRSILHSLEHLAVLSEQRKLPLGLLMMDLDFFKRINDTYGHDCGDIVLKEAASRMKQCIRNTDVVGRFGGEEFLAVIPNCSGEELLRLAERIRQSMKEPVAYKQLLIPVAMSIGASVHFQSKSDVLESLKRADQSLYVAKEMGRDRVVCAWMLDEYSAKNG